MALLPPAGPSKGPFFLPFTWLPGGSSFYALPASSWRGRKFGFRKFCHLHVSLAKDLRGPLIIGCLLLHLRESFALKCICRINHTRIWTLVWWQQILCEFPPTSVSKSGSQIHRPASGCSCSLWAPVAPRLQHTNLPKVIYCQLRKVHSAIFQIAKPDAIRWLLASSWNWNWIAIDIDWLRAWATTRPNHVQPAGDFPILQLSLIVVFLFPLSLSLHRDNQILVELAGWLEIEFGVP